MRRTLAMLILIPLMLVATTPARAEGEAAGDFDYYVMALSWSPTWCALEGDARQSPQCARGANFGWVLHGLWPQFEEDGWPSDCQTTARNPSRQMTRDMADIMGTDGLAWYQWKKHGRCSGLEAAAYFEAARAAYEAVTRPPLLRQLDHAVRLPASVIEDAFLEENPQLEADGVTVTCKAGRIQEVRICLTKELEPRACSASVARDCSARDALFEAID